MKEKMIYLSGLNGLRAVAALSVLVAHIFQTDLADFGLKRLFDLPLAGYGVTLFFVISGFLITFLLIKEFSRTQTVAIRKFYLRRILRIWPIYYLYILIAIFVYFLLHRQSAILVPEMWFYVFYAANVPFIFQNGIMILVHYWSIGVEEQFYLFWPWLVKFSKEKVFHIAVVLFFVFFLSKSMSWYFLGTESYLYRFFAVTRFHCMMLGAIGAFIYTHNYKFIIRLLTNRFTQIISWILFFLMGIEFVHIPAPIAHELIAVISLSMIFSQVTSKSWIFNLEYSFFDFIGKISYGIYVIHPIIILLLSFVIKPIDMVLWQKYILVYFTVISFTIFFAWLSYRFYEQPFLKLKSKFAVVKSSNSRVED